MKQLRSLVLNLLLLGVGITSGLSEAELTASQQVQPPTAAVGETAMVIVMLAYNGDNSTQVTVTPSLPPGIVTDSPGIQSMELYPGRPSTISYPIRAVASGTYLIISQISYTEGGVPYGLSLVEGFNAIGQAQASQETAARKQQAANTFVPSNPSSSLQSGNLSMPS